MRARLRGFPLLHVLSGPCFGRTKHPETGFEKQETRPPATPRLQDLDPEVFDLKGTSLKAGHLEKRSLTRGVDGEEGNQWMEL
eukprot:CAMPEP_0175082592 /NCGR_PEP_ID=MMETSP0052_2-20121109/26846_1 /TAXON_ID=51329 ORGANISM="Polytomella parva, Strain SAG 63-3" /NCGR_SAMPLE_ID=MMETSP0052_2 /ASSEMBLY_ACC=CAM_ASM_000194 /LENGTH=82 /DNA_ID=CAMNT_0016353815 /DNA_START=92 /DNA_END=340 /DNA_ORIENTATION=-